MADPVNVLIKDVATIASPATTNIMPVSDGTSTAKTISVAQIIGLHTGATTHLAIGETSGDAYRGDRGKTAYDHSQTAHAPADAEKNVNADWDAVSGDAQILNKPVIPSISGLLNESAHDALDHAGLTGVLALGTTNTTAAAGDHNHSGTYAPALGADDNYVTDDEKIKLSNLSGTNSGDQSVFKTISVSGQTDVVADTTTDTLTLVGAGATTITTDATTDTITITSVNTTYTPSDTVTSETSYGASASAGTSANYARGDHTHGTPAEVTRATLGVATTDTPTFADVTITGLTGTVIGSTGSVETSIENLDTSIQGKENFHGIEAAGALSFDNSTHILTIASGTNTYWYHGVKYTTSSAITCDLDNFVTLTANTLYFVYFEDASGTLKASATAWNLLTKVPVATVFWNGSAGAVGYECHRHTRDLDWHRNAHTTIGARISAGDFAITAPSVASPTTVDFAGGTLWDEDIANTIGQQTNCRIWYQTGASTYTFVDSNSIYPTAVSFVNSSGYTLTSVGNSAYINMWVYASNDISRPIYAFVETVAATYTTVANARAVTPPNLSAYGLTQEMKLLYRVILKGDETFVESTDYRASASLPAGGTTAPSASSVTFTTSGNISAPNVQAAIEELDNEKAPKADPTFTGTINIPTGSSTVATLLNTSESAALSVYGGAWYFKTSPTAGYWAALGSGVFSHTGDIQAGGRFVVSDGTATAPSIRFTNDQYTGLYRTGTDQLGFTVAQTQRLNLTTAGATVTGALSATSIQNTPIGSTTASTGAFTTLSASGVTSAADGSVSSPGIAFTSDPNTGIYRIGADNLGIACNGAKVVDVGTTGVAVTGSVTVNAADARVIVGDVQGTYGSWLINRRSDSYFYPGYGLTFWNSSVGGSVGQYVAPLYLKDDGTIIMQAASNIVSNGNVLIGKTTDDGSKLQVSGNLSVTGTIGCSSSPPASASASGVAGTITWDANYIYVCVATNTWKRTAISTWT